MKWHDSFLIVSLAFGLFLVSCDGKSSKETAEAVERQHKDQERKEKLKAFAAKHEATGDWVKVLDRRPFTLDLQTALIRTDHRPVLFIASVNDIEPLGKDRYRVTFEGEAYSSQPGVAFILECTSEHISQIQDSFSEYAVVARIASVRRIQFGIKSETATRSEETPALRVKTANMFEASGVCVGVVPTR